MASHKNLVVAANAKAMKRQRLANQVIIKAKSSPAGIDWRLIRDMRETVRRKKSSSLVLP